jgi:hypothetical protein
MARILVLLLGLAIVAFAVKYELAGTRTAGPAINPQVETGIRPIDPNNNEHTRPRQQLDNVRERTHELEQQDQQRVDDALKKTE